MRTVFLFELNIVEMTAKIGKYENLISEPNCSKNSTFTASFVERHGFRGKTLEQSIEKVYGNVNIVFCRLCAVKNRQKLFLQLIETQCVKKFIFDFK